MAQVSDWQTEEAKNTSLDELTLSGEGGLYTNKIMCAVKKKFDDVDGKLAKVQGAYVFKGTKADMTALEAVTDPAVGDVYSVTALGGENYAWDGTAWDSLGTSDANVVHKTGDETITGKKSINKIVFKEDAKIINKVANAEVLVCGGAGTDWEDGAYLGLYGAERASDAGTFILSAGSATATKRLIGRTDGTINWAGQPLQTVSDGRQKTAISVVPDAVLDAWEDVSWGQFQYLDAVRQKGADGARLHLGLIAQMVKAAFENRGLDACAYGILCYEQPDDAWSVRYAEALAMEACCERRRADRLEARIAALEAQINGVN